MNTKLRIQSGEWLAIAVLLFLGISWAGLPMAQAAEELKEEGKVQVASVTGRVSAVSKQGIAVEYAYTSKTSKEMYLPLAEKVRLQRLQDLKEINPGDTVEVRYQQTYKEEPDEKKTILKTAATEISLLKKAPQEGALISKEEEPE